MRRAVKAGRVMEKRSWSVTAVEPWRISKGEPGRARAEPTRARRANFMMTSYGERDVPGRRKALGERGEGRHSEREVKDEVDILTDRCAMAGAAFIPKTLPRRTLNNL